MDKTLLKRRRFAYAAGVGEEILSGLEAELKRKGVQDFTFDKTKNILELEYDLMKVKFEYWDRLTL